jgi:hypothetical protein
MARFPKPYADMVPDTKSSPGIVRVDLDNMGIGARKSGMPSAVSTGPGGIDHVGKDATIGGRK